MNFVFEKDFYIYRSFIWENDKFHIRTKDKKLDSGLLKTDEVERNVMLEKLKSHPDFDIDEIEFNKYGDIVEDSENLEKFLKAYLNLIFHTKKNRVYVSSDVDYCGDATIHYIEDFEKYDLEMYKGNPNVAYGKLPEGKIFADDEGDFLTLTDGPKRYDIDQYASASYKK